MDNPVTVLLAEDEAALAHIVRESLEERGFKVIICPDGEVALKQYEKHKPDILVLDIMMPKKDGFAVAGQVRQLDKVTPIIFLTARSQPKDVVAGFGIGANDYLKKPFSMEELIVRMEVQLSSTKLINKPQQAKPEALQFGEFVFYANRHALEHGLNTRQLTSRESEILKLLYHNQQQLLERSTLLQTLWGSDNFFNARSLDVFITKLRRHLAADPSVQIINVRGSGYKLVY
jgi:DNA-binding response OmpR family regulator